MNKKLWTSKNLTKPLFFQCISKVWACKIRWKLKIFNQNMLSEIVLNFATFLFDLLYFWSAFGHILESFWLPFGVLGSLWMIFRKLWASFGFNLGALGAAWSPWAPILVSEIDCWLIFGRFGPPNWIQLVKIGLPSFNLFGVEACFPSLNPKFQSQYVNLTMSIGSPPWMRRSPRSGLN